MAAMQFNGSKLTNPLKLLLTGHVTECQKGKNYV